MATAVINLKKLQAAADGGGVPRDTSAPRSSLFEGRFFGANLVAVIVVSLEFADYAAAHF